MPICFYCICCLPFSVVVLVVDGPVAGVALPAAGVDFGGQSAVAGHRVEVECDAAVGALVDDGSACHQRDGSFDDIFYSKKPPGAVIACLAACRSQLYQLYKLLLKE